jgi:hypothetical protein
VDQVLVEVDPLDALPLDRDLPPVDHQLLELLAAQVHRAVDVRERQGERGDAVLADVQAAPLGGPGGQPPGLLQQGLERRVPEVLGDERLAQLVARRVGVDDRLAPAVEELVQDQARLPRADDEVVDLRDHPEPRRGLTPAMS